MEFQLPNNTILQSVDDHYGSAHVPEDSKLQDTMANYNMDISSIEDIIDEDHCEDNLDFNDGEKTPSNVEEFHGIEEIVEDVLEPKVGMIFDTPKEAYDFYNNYAREIGFSVRKQRSNKSKADRSKLLRQLLVCACEGSYKKIKTPVKRRDNRRFECNAMFEYKLAEDDKYKVIAFQSDHTHELVPLRSRHYLKSQRKIEFSQVGIIDKMHSSGISQSDIYAYLRAEAGGAQNLNFIKSDSNNLIQRIRAEFFKKGDAQCLQDYFKQKKQENKHFLYSFRTNEDGRIRSVFFCDAKSRRDYGLFGDAMCFDTTFSTNNYNMLCAPIVGINNHGQTTLFGCGLLDGETTDAVLWLFTTFLEAMGGKKPVSIFTDQSRAISNAVDVMFPESHHGLCLWHICQNAAKHLSKVFSQYKSFAPKFKACIYDPETIEEFEQSWDKLHEDYGLRCNEWLQGLYGLQEKWAQVYSHSYFCAGMTTTQRSESINKFLKAYFGKGNIVLREFVDQYSKAMADRREKEIEAENKTHQTSPNLISGWSVEREATKIYTRKMSYCFQEELQRTIGLLLELEKDDGEVKVYTSKDINDKTKIRTLTYKQSEQSVSCTCRKIEFSGMFCSHALKLFHDLQFKSLPEKYYLKRWTRAATDEAIFYSYGDLIPNDNDPSLTACYSELSHISQRIVTGCTSMLKDVFPFTKSLLLEVEEKVKVFKNSLEEQRFVVQKNTNDIQHVLMSNLNDEQPLQDPLKRGCPGQSKKRIKDPLETNAPKKNSSGTKAPKKNSTKRTGSKVNDASNNQTITGVKSVIRPPTQQTFGSMQQPPYSQNVWQWTYPPGIHPQGFIPLYNVIGSQQQRPFLPSDPFMPQQVSANQMNTPQRMPQSINIPNSLASNTSN